MFTAPEFTMEEMMKNKNANWFVVSLVTFAFLAFPVTGLSEVCGVIDTANAVPEQGYAWNTQQKFFMASDSSSYPNVSPLRIFENGIELGPAHSLHADIRDFGAGRFSYWNNLLYFSTLDNSDPRTNGRTYQYGGTCMPTFTVTKVADVPTGYGTFHSNNQKIVQNAYGLFMTYRYDLPAPNNLPGVEDWRLARSIDGGKTWATIWRGMTISNAPILETDAHGSIFLIHSDETILGGNGNAAFYRFDPEKSFTNPTMSTITGGSAGKYTSVWDEARQRLYYMVWDTWHTNTVDPNNNFFALDRAGNVLFKFPLTCRYVIGLSDSSIPTPGCTTTSTPVDAGVHYPHLEIDGTRLYAAWTTSPSQAVQDATKQRYRAIFYIYSEDGGTTWLSPSTPGPLTLPIVGNEHGPAQMVNPIEELSYPTSTQQYSIWLWNVASKGGFLHFAYHNELSPYNSHYMRFAPTTGVRSIDAPTPKGQYISTVGASGFFATGPSSSTPLFITTSTYASERLAILSSSDLGQSWNDVAISNIRVPAGYVWYAISGNRRLTRTGDIIGHATTTQFPSTSDTRPVVHFFRQHVVDQTNDLSAQWVFVSLDTTKAAPNGGFGYTISMVGVEFGSDTLQNLRYSKLRLFENGVEIGPAHSYHADIRNSGGGRFSHWTSNTLYFSASDNSDPRTSGKTYQVAFPSTEAQGLTFYGKINFTNITLDQGNAYATSSQIFGTNGDSPSDPTGSGLLLYEDGVLIGPAHTALDTIRTTGSGEYLHWGNTLYFSASDNTDPRTNGRSYTFSMDGSAAFFIGEDLSITLSSSPNPVLLGNNITYTITVTNNGPAPASGVVVTDNLGSAMFVPMGSSTECSGMGSVSCAVGNLANGASATLTIVASPSSAGMFTNTASVMETNLFDPNPNNNSALVATNVQAVLSVARLGVGGGTVTSAPAGIDCGATCSAGYDVGTSVALTESSDANSAFIGWSGCDTITENTCTVTMSGSKLVTAGFDKSADLSITNTDNPDPVFAGMALDYMVTVTNNGPSDATGVVMTDTLPSGVSFSPMNPSQGSCTGSSTITCSLGSLPKNGSATVAMTVTPYATGVITNTASVAGSESDPNATNNTASITTTVDPAVDLAVTIVDSPDPVLLGQPVNYTVTVTNNGPSNATGVTATGTLADCNVGNLASGASVNCPSTVTASSVGTLTQSMSVSRLEFELNLANDVASASTAVQAPDLAETALSVSASGTNLLINDSVTNQGTGAAAAFDIGYYFSTDASYQSGTDTLLCTRNVASLPAGGSSPASGTTQTSCPIPSVVAGSYHVIAIADSGNTVTESDETNNSRSAPVMIGGIDLLPTAMSASRSGTTKVLVTETVKNQGNVAAGSFTIKYYLSTNTTYEPGIDIVLASNSNGTGTCNRTRSSLNAGASHSVRDKTCHKPTGAATGVDYYVLVVDDSEKTVVEYSESNNVRATAGTIRW